MKSNGKILLAAAAIAAAAAPTRAQLNYTPYAVTTIAGKSGNYGHVDATGSAARFEYTYGVAVDSSGNVYVADTAVPSPDFSPGYGVIREVTPAGAVTTLAGLSGTGGTTDGTGTGALFGDLGGIAIDSSGFLYVTDRTYGSIRKINSSTGQVTTLVPAGTLNNPIGIAVDSSGYLYVAENGNYVIRKITPGGSVSTLAGKAGTSGYANGTGTAAVFGGPNGVAVDGSGNVYVTDSVLNIIRKITSAGVVTTYAGQPGVQGSADGSLSAALFNRPFGIAVDSSYNLYVTDDGALIREISASGNVTTLAGDLQSLGSNDGTGNSALFLDPDGIAVSSSGTLCIGDSYNYTVRTASGSGSSGSLPTIQFPPESQTVNAGASVTFAVTANGTAPLSYQWTFNGGGVGANASSYSIVNVQTSNAGSYAVTVTNSFGHTSAAATLTVNPGPFITAQPQSQTVDEGSTTTFSVTATGTAPLSYQWQFNGTAIAGATSSSYTILDTAATAAGSYTVVVTDNSGNKLTSNAATLTVNPGPLITAQPQSQTVGDGSTTTFSVTATGTGILTYQWQFNGAAIAGETSSSYTISNTGATAAGSYTVVVTDGLGNALTSNAASLGVHTDARLTNISSRAFVGTGGNILIAGFVVGGSGSKSILLRGVGPTLAEFGVGGVLTVPQLTLYDGEVTPLAIAANIGWGNASTLGSSSVQAEITPATGAIMSSLGAFALPANSADCAMVAGLPTLPSGNYSAEVAGANNTTGVAMAEIYDADTGTPTARLINISSRAAVGTGGNILIAGFVIQGTTSETVLLRGVGPTLAEFGVGGVLTVPQLTLYDGEVTPLAIAANIGWGNATTPGPSPVPAEIVPATTAIMSGVGAFALPAGSADCAMVVTLPPGIYTAEVSGVNAATGIGLVEVYEVH